MKLTVGEGVGVESVNGGPRVAGVLHGFSPNHLAVMRQDDQIGQVCVNFPRIGYRIFRS